MGAEKYRDELSRRSSPPGRRTRALRALEEFLRIASTELGPACGEEMRRADVFVEAVVKSACGSSVRQSVLNTLVRRVPENPELWDELLAWRFLGSMGTASDGFIARANQWLEAGESDSIAGPGACLFPPAPQTPEEATSTILRHSKEYFERSGDRFLFDEGSNKPRKRACLGLASQLLARPDRKALLEYLRSPENGMRSGTASSPGARAEEESGRLFRLAHQRIWRIRRSAEREAEERGNRRLSGR